MSNELIERLRVDSPLSLPGTGIIGAMREAADAIASQAAEIERLTTDVEHYKYQAHGAGMSRVQIAKQDEHIERLTKMNGELLAMLDRCVPHINPKVIDKIMMKYAPIDECYLNTLAASLVSKAKEQP